jgi:membrane protease YdiL (CAAX protease family)
MERSMEEQVLLKPDIADVNRLGSFVRKNALILYFSLAFLISWVFWFIEPNLRSKDPVIATFFVQLGSYGPILAAMMVSVMSSSEPKYTPLRRKLLVGSFALAAAIFSNWLLAKYIFEEASQPIHLFLLGLLTLLPAWIFFNAGSGRGNLHDLLGSLARLRINPRWFAVAFSLMPTLSMVGVLLTALITGRPVSSWVMSIKSNPIMPNLALAFFATALYGGPLGEEAGWRGFALNRLQKRFDPLLASVYLGLIWGIWHLPLHVTGYYNQVFGNPWMGLLLRLFTTIPLAVLFTWLFNRTHGNLLVMIILHTMVNITSALVAPEIGMYITMTIAVVMMVVFDRMYKMPDNVPPI